MGLAYIALFPFDIHVQEKAASPIRLSHRKPVATVYWPHWNEPDTGRALSAVRASVVPSRPGYPFYVVPPLDIAITVQPQAGQRFANAMRVDVAETPTRDEEVGRLIRSLTRWMRAKSGQWWIGHSHRSAEGLIRAQYDIDSKGRLSNRDCVSAPRIEPHAGCERCLTHADFQATCAAVQAGREPAPHHELILDALYFSIHEEDQRRALLDACIACDLAILHESIRAAREQKRAEEFVRHSLSDRDLLSNVREHVPQLFGQHANLSIHQPDDFELIRRLWAARGAIAHGQLPLTGEAGRSELPTREDAVMMIQAAMRLIERMERLPN